MKVCQVCGETYSNHVEFCFVDGDVLVAQASVFDVPEPKVMVQGSQVPVADRPEDVPPAVLPDASAEDTPESVGPEPEPADLPAPTQTPVPAPEVEVPDAEVAPEAEPAAAPEPSASSQVDTQVPDSPPDQDVPLAKQTTAIYERPQRASEKATPPPASQISTATPLAALPRIPDPEAGQHKDGNKKYLFMAVAALAVVIVLGGIGVVATGLLASSGKPPPQVIEPKVAAGTPVAPSPTPAPVAAPAPTEKAPAPEPAIGTADVGDPAPAPVAPAPAPSSVAPVAPAPAPAPAQQPEPAPVETPTPEPVVEVPREPATPTATGRVGAVMIFYSGRSGDTLLIDGQARGSLPVRSELAEGNHSFTVRGAGGEVTVSKMINLKPAGQTTLIHLK